MLTPQSNGWYSLNGDVSASQLAELAHLASAAPHGKLDKLELKASLATVRSVRPLASLPIRQWRLWCRATRPAIRQVLQTPGLERLEVLQVSGPGCLRGVGQARSLSAFGAYFGLNAADILAIAECGTLQELRAHGAGLTPKAIDALIALPQLATLDLEDSCFDDRMAKQVARSATITSLDIGHTRITRAGLAHLAGMQQLQSLDLWLTALTAQDLALLLELPRLEALSLGGPEGTPPLDPQPLTELMLAAPALKRVWLEGVALDPTQKQALDAKLESLRLD